jgi:hypothetical protein
MATEENLKQVKIIVGRICATNEQSPIAVELVDGNLRSYFAGTIPAPKDKTEKPGENGRIQGVVMLMPRRDEKNFLGVFHGAIGAANFKKMCFGLGLTNG